MSIHGALDEQSGCLLIPIRLLGRKKALGHEPESRRNQRVLSGELFVRILKTAREEGQMMDPESSRAWRRLLKEVKENVPIVLRGLASSGKRVTRRVYSAVVRGSKSLLRRAREWRPSVGGTKAFASQLSRVRLRSPIYKV